MSSKKMVRLAKLDQAAFNFDEPPARGGFGWRAGTDLNAIKQQLIEQSNVFKRMQLALRSKALGESEKRSTWPAPLFLPDVKANMEMCSKSNMPKG